MKLSKNTGSASYGWTPVLTLISCEYLSLVYTLTANMLSSSMRLELQKIISEDYGTQLSDNETEAIGASLLNSFTVLSNVATRQSINITHDNDQNPKTPQ